MRFFRCLIVGLAFLVIPVCALQWGYYAKFEKGIIARELSATELVADMQRERMEAFVVSNLDRLDLVTSRRIFRDLLRDYLDNRSKDIQYQLNRSLADARRAVPVFEKLSVADLSGRIITSTDNALIGTEVADRELFTQGSKESVIALSFPAQGSYDQAHILLSGPLVVGEKVAAVAILQVYPAELLALLRGPQKVVEDYWTLVQRVDAMRVALISPAPNGMSLTQNIVSEDSDPNLSAALRGADITVLESQPSPAIRVTRFVPDVGWTLVMARDATPLMAAMADFHNSILLLALLLSTFVAGVSLYMAHLLTRIETGQRRHPTATNR